MEQWAANYMVYGRHKERQMQARRAGKKLDDWQNVINRNSATSRAGYIRQGDPYPRLEKRNIVRITPNWYISRYHYGLYTYSVIMLFPVTCLSKEEDHFE